MDPITLLNLISLIAKASPVASTVFEDCKTMVQSLFSDGIISKAQQAAYMAWADKHMESVLAGQKPLEMMTADEISAATRPALTPTGTTVASGPADGTTIAFPGSGTVATASAASAATEAPKTSETLATANVAQPKHSFGGSASELSQ